MRSSENLSVIVAVGLVLIFCSGMNLLLARTGREGYPVLALSPRAGVEPYGGNLRFNEVVAHRLLDLSIMRERALARAQLMTGLRTPHPERYVVRVRDFSSDEVGASSRPVRSESGDVLLISVASRQLKLEQMDLEDAMTHELVHGLMRERLGARYRELPDWVREGLAVWAGSQILERARFAQSAAEEEGFDLAALLDEQPLLPSLGDDYLEGALLFQGVADEFGSEAVRFFIRSLGDESPEEALSRVTGRSWLELEQLRIRAARRVLQQVRPPAPTVDEVLFGQNFL
ncbi:MAG: hypothetical protein GYA21_15695 [Myxococcales bacterium]|nr:hypothetical protein [Myxococcales bacterium]